MSKRGLSLWIKENKVMVVVVPLIFGVHWGWYELQKVPALGGSGATKQMESPIIGAVNAYKKWIQEKLSNVSDSKEK